MRYNTISQPGFFEASFMRRSPMEGGVNINSKKLININTIFSKIPCLSFLEFHPPVTTNPVQTNCGNLFYTSKIYRTCFSAKISFPEETTHGK